MLANRADEAERLRATHAALAEAAEDELARSALVGSTADRMAALLEKSAVKKKALKVGLCRFGSSDDWWCDDWWCDDWWSLRCVAPVELVSHFDRLNCLPL